jgi:hypothetical protein
MYQIKYAYWKQAAVFYAIFIHLLQRDQNVGLLHLYSKTTDLTKFLNFIGLLQIERLKQMKDIKLSKLLYFMPSSFIYYKEIKIF